MEEILGSLGVPYTIVRPTLVFGEGDLLLNNVAWALRRFSVFPVFGRGEYLDSQFTPKTWRPRLWGRVHRAIASLPPLGRLPSP